MADPAPAIGLVIRHAYLWWKRPPPGGGYAYGLLPGAMTRDLVAQVKANAQDQSLLVVTRTDLA